MECCIKLIKFIAVDIGYCGETVPEILKKASNSDEFSELVFLSEFDDCESCGFYQLWSAELSVFEKMSALNSDDIALLKSFGNKLGTTDCLHQTQLCNEYVCRFEERYEYAKNKLSERLRICRFSGAACGLTVLILML